MSEDKADYNPNDHLLNLKGKAYLPVAARLVWFRQDYPEGQIETTLVQVDDKQAIFRARVSTGAGGVAEATGTETPRDFGDYIEKAETKAVGRALGYLGYGTAAAGFEEGNRIVDAPQPSQPARAGLAKRPPLNAAPVGSPYDAAERDRLAQQVRRNDEALSNAEYERYHELERMAKEQPPRPPARATAPVASPAAPGRTEALPQAPQGLVAAPPARKIQDWTNEELLAFAQDEARNMTKRLAAAGHYLKRATSEFDVLAWSKNLTTLHPEDVAGLRDTAIEELRANKPASFAG